MEKGMDTMPVIEFDINDVHAAIEHKSIGVINVVAI